MPRLFGVTSAPSFVSSDDSLRFSFRGTDTPQQIAIARATAVAAQIELTNGAAIPMPSNFAAPQSSNPSSDP